MGSRLEQLKNLKVKMHDWETKDINLFIVKKVNETGQESWKCEYNDNYNYHYLFDNEEIKELIADFTIKFGTLVDKEKAELEFHKYDDYDDSTITKE